MRKSIALSNSHAEDSAIFGVDMSQNLVCDPLLTERADKKED